MYGHYPYGRLWPLLLSLTESEMEKANIDVLEKKAESCDWEAAIKLVYYVPESMSYSFMIRKRLELVKTVRSGRKATREYKRLKKYLNEWSRAERGERPKAGGTVKINREPEILMEEFVEIVREITEIRNLSSNERLPQLFAITQEYWIEVGKRRISSYLEEIGPEAVANTREEDIKEQVEKQFIEYILNDNEDIVEIAIEVLAEKYNVEESTIRNRLPNVLIRKAREIANHYSRGQVRELIIEILQQEKGKAEYRKNRKSFQG